MWLNAFKVNKQKQLNELNFYSNRKTETDFIIKMMFPTFSEKF